MKALAVPPLLQPYVDRARPLLEAVSETQLAKEFRASRQARATAAAFAFSFVFFWFMQLAITGGTGEVDKGVTLQAIDFVRLKKDSDLETRTRVKPPKPPPPKEPPPPPKIKIATPPPQATPVPFAMPKVVVPTQISGGAFLGGYVGGDASAYGELIPLVRIQPQYPRNAARDKIEGYVVMELTVNPDGSVRSARPVESKPRGVFEQAAVQSIIKWRFKPKVVDGKPVEQKALQRLDFKLGGEEP